MQQLIQYVSGKEDVMNAETSAYQLKVTSTTLKSFVCDLLPPDLVFGTELSAHNICKLQMYTLKFSTQIKSMAHSTNYFSHLEKKNNRVQGVDSPMSRVIVSGNRGINICPFMMIFTPLFTLTNSFSQTLPMALAQH